MKPQGRTILPLTIGLIVILLLVTVLLSGQGQMDSANFWGVMTLIVAAITFLLAFPQFRGNRETGTAVQPKHQPSPQNRINLLAQIRVQWVDGVLKQSLHNQVFIELGIDQRPEALQSPFEFKVQRRDLPDSIATGRQVAQIYDQAGGQLLILGDPGGGKTTTLLELARELVARAEAHTEHPIPVIFSLSSWDQMDTTLADWMVDELQGRYNVPRPTGQAWVETTA